MSELYSYFQAYLQLNIPKTKWILVFGIVFMTMFLILQERGCVKQYAKPVGTIVLGILLSLIVSFVFVMTLFRIPSKEDVSFCLKPFESYWISAEGNIEVMLQIIINIVMFIPIGFLLPCCFKLYEKYRYVLLTVVKVSISIELFQLIFKIGSFEIDDVINNVFGTMIGLGIYVLAEIVKKYHTKEEDNYEFFI